MIYKDELLENINNGKKNHYFFFWGHTQKKKDLIDKSCLSQWFLSKFIVDNIAYISAEHYMMVQKAKLFNDMDSVYKILNAKTPKEAKFLGRKVKNFDTRVWELNAFNIVVDGNLAKFSQNKNQKEFILSTKDDILVEASPYDRIWGIGLSEDDEKSKKPLLWRGDNILGFALMKVREQFKMQKII